MLEQTIKRMKTIYKMLLAGLFSFAMLTAVAQEQPAEAEPQHEGCPMHMLSPSLDYVSVKVCYAPDLGAFVAVDSVECSIHLVAIVDGKLDTIGKYKTDNTHKRHDLKNIMRPVSVSAMGPYVLVLASAVNDSAYVAILDSNMHELTRRSFSSPMYAMHREHGVLIVAGRNPYGYDLNIVPLRGLDFEAFATGDIMTHHYRVAKQSEKIKQTDPVGIGLTAVAVAVVFLALVFIALILQGGSKLMSGVGEKKETKKKGGAAINAAAAAASKEGEIYAAIATAIHLYNNELHDEEDTVITIAKVEREWTPWNAKYYNMNHYFNNKR
jgi:Na+-transporting methylmalonyl-CoA/oxaloacetate decarboxylase gamma subunit